MPDEQLTIGELARTTGVATSALRYWEELGLLPAPARLCGQRRYPASAVGLVGLILSLRDVGFTLRELKALIASRSDGLDAWREFAVVRVCGPGSGGRLFGRCPGWCGAGHGREALRSLAGPGRLLAAPGWSGQASRPCTAGDPRPAGG
jgi:DNA-binding transcriptional MerR regulator